MTPDIATHFAIQRLQDAYIDALDGDRLEYWPEFFVDDCLYEIIPKENVDAGFPAPVMYCQGKAMLRDRVISLRNANIFAPVTYRHFLSGLVWEVDGEDIVARSNYLVINTSQAGQSTVYQTGTYLDRIVDVGGEPRFRSRRVVYDTSRIQTLLAIPI